MFKKIGKLPSPKNLEPLTKAEQKIVDDFHKLSYRLWSEGRSSLDLGWLGFAMIKNPLDLWIYQEIIVETLPEILIETGTLYGGSALYFASIFELLGFGEVVTIDVGGEDTRIVGGLTAGDVRPEHPLITYITGSSADYKTFRKVLPKCRGKRVMVILDSDHSKEHVLKELNLYSQLVSRGCYLIVEDSNVNNHPVYPEHGEGPYEATHEFMKTASGFKMDRDRERFMFTCAPEGFLKKEEESLTAGDLLASTEEALKAGEMDKALGILELGSIKFPDVSEIEESLKILKERIGE